jgi:hypothetical protein
MPKTVSEAARVALAATDWSKVDAMTDQDIARQIASNLTPRRIWRRRSTYALSAERRG